MTTPYFDKHRDKLDAAVAASASREFYSAYDESPSPRVYGESAAGEGKAAFEAWQGRAFPLETPGNDGTVATERSPFGFDLGVRYPARPRRGRDAVGRPGGDEGLARRRAGGARRLSASRSSTGCTSGSSSSPTPSSTPAGRRS